jgi:hypothetical protein
VPMPGVHIGQLNLNLNLRGLRHQDALNHSPHGTAGLGVGLTEHSGKFELEVLQEHQILQGWYIKDFPHNSTSLRYALKIELRDQTNLINAITACPHLMCVVCINLLRKPMPRQLLTLFI